jgi:hypothetical protein
VFKLKDKLVDGIPPQGINAFPFIYDEPPIDPQGYGEHGYLVMEGDIFTEDSWAKAMQRAVVLVKESGMGWIVRHVSSHPFNFLERCQALSTLGEQYNLVHGIFKDLAEQKYEKLTFWRVRATTEASSITQFTDAVYLAPKDPQRLTTLLQSLGVTAITNSQLEVESLPEKAVHITRLHPLFEGDLPELRVTRFCMDFILTPTADWNEPFAERHIHETHFSLLHFTGFAEISLSAVTEFTKIAYFMDRLSKFHRGFHRMLSSMRAVLPPAKMLPYWGNCALNVDTHPLLAKIGRIACAQKSEHPYFTFLLTDHAHGITRPASVPDGLAQLSDTIWHMITDSIVLIHEVHKTNQPKDADRQALQKYAEVFRVFIRGDTMSRATVNLGVLSAQRQGLRF